MLMGKSVAPEALNRKNPFFSVLIPSYNRPEYITKCIDSILDNNFDDYEIIISDDHSPRGNEIETAIKPYLEFKNIHFFRQVKNLKEPGNKNFLVEQAKGEYNIIIGDDDKLYPGALSKIRKYINKYPLYDLYGFGYTVIDENDKFYYSRHAPKNIEISIEYPDIVKHLYDSGIFPFWLYHPATFCCKNGVEKEIPYSKDAGIGEDLLFLFDFINKGKKMSVIPESLFSWRKIQDKNTTGQKNQSLGDFNNVRARKNILDHLKEREDLHPFISFYISSFEYRKRFLYDPIMVDKAGKKDIIKEIRLSQQDIEELESCYDGSGYFDIHYKPYFSRCNDFIKLFGVPGIFEICKVFFQRINYRLGMLSNRTGFTFKG